MPINKAIFAALTQVVMSIDANTKELKITGKDGGITVTQQFAVNAPCLIIYTPATQNFSAINQMIEWAPGMQIVDVLTLATLG